METHMQTMTDPLSIFMAGLVESSRAYPLALASTAFDIEVAAGLAVVTTRRVFRNGEAAAIEAILTFPVPVHAVLFSLEAMIDGRIVKAHAQRQEAARATYEEGIERGKAAVLHEEVLRGVHMLSIANVRPGGEIAVTTRWVASLSLIGGAGHLRIPLTVGDVYGCSGLSDADDLIHADRPGQTAQVHIIGADGPVEVTGIILVDGVGEVPMNRPIDLTTPVWTPARRVGRAADGRVVELLLSPASVGEANAAVAVMIDCSGSMSSPLDAAHSRLSKHAAAAAIARKVSTTLGDGDAVDLWEFNTQARPVGSAGMFTAEAIDRLLAKLSAPGDGTEIGQSIEEVAKRSRAHDILLITDGKSYALDVQRLAQLGRRISVLLIGEDSLEAKVGHLAALTGGELFIVTAGNLDSVARTLVAAIRQPFSGLPPIEGSPASVTIQRGGVELSAVWRDAGDEDAPAGDPSVTAMATSMALPAMSEDAAARLAEAEGLVTHLTSLVLVDEAGETQEGLPGMRKIALESPAVRGYAVASTGAALTSVPVACMPAPQAVMASRSMAMPFMSAAPAAGGLPPGIAAAASPAAPIGPLGVISHQADALRRLGLEIAWDAVPGDLLAGNLSSLKAPVARLLQNLADYLPDEVVLAFGNIDRVLLVLGLAAMSVASSNRPADRLAKRIFAAVDPVFLESLRRAMG